MSEEVRMCVILLFNIIWNVNIVIESSFRANVAFCYLCKSIADMYTYKFIIVINFSHAITHQTSFQGIITPVLLES